MVSNRIHVNEATGLAYLRCVVKHVRLKLELGVAEFGIRYFLAAPATTRMPEESLNSTPSTRPVYAVGSDDVGT